MKQTQKTIVQKEEKIRETYIKKRFTIFSWYKIVKVDSLGKDLIIITAEDYDKIIVNGKEITK